jgi:hypothetical protein
MRNAHLHVLNNTVSYHIATLACACDTKTYLFSTTVSEESE